jgi:hypothetical protein
MSDLATVSFNATLPTTLVKDFFEGLIRLEDARQARFKLALDEVLKTVSSLCSSPELSCPARTVRVETKSATVVPEPTTTSTENTPTVEVSASLLGNLNTESLENLAKTFAEGVTKCKMQKPTYSEGAESTGFQIGGFDDIIKAFGPMMDSFLGSSKKPTETPVVAENSSAQTTTSSH